MNGLTICQKNTVKKNKQLRPLYSSSPDNCARERRREKNRSSEQGARSEEEKDGRGTEEWGSRKPRRCSGGPRRRACGGCRLGGWPSGPIPCGRHAGGLRKKLHGDGMQRAAVLTIQRCAGDVWASRALVPAEPSRPS
jgi:hypothetical protein